MALESFKEKHAPKILTYIKYANDLEDAHQEVKTFMLHLEQNLKHYYNLYQNIDTLTLQILLQLQNLELSDHALTITQGEISLDGKRITSCAQIPMFAGNADYAALKADYLHVNASYLQLKEQFLCNSNDSDLEQAYFKIATQRGKTSMS